MAVPAAISDVEGEEADGHLDGSSLRAGGALVGSVATTQSQLVCLSQRG